MTLHEELIHRYLDDPAALNEAELEQLISQLRAQPAQAVQLREQLILNDLLGQKLAVDRKNFSIMVQQRLSDFEQGEEEVYNQVSDLRAIAEAEIEKVVRPPGINPWVKYAGGISLLVAAVLCIAVWQYQQAAPRAVANIEELSGQVARLSGGKEEALRLGQAISTGDSIVAAAGSTVVWKYKDGTTVRLLGDSESALSAESATQAKEVKLSRGELSASVAKQTRGPMVFTTPHATATVRGTQLRLVVGDANTQLDVTEGKVDFQRNGGSQVLQLAANESGIATASNIQPREVVWPVNRGSAVFLFDGHDRKQFARHPETGVPRETPLEPRGEVAASKVHFLSLRGGHCRSEDAGHDMLPHVKRSCEFACAIVFLPEKRASSGDAVLCAWGPAGNENFLLLQRGQQLVVQCGKGLGAKPIVFDLGEITLGARHDVSFACRDGQATAVVDGVEIALGDQLENKIPEWAEGPLVVGADATGKRVWRGEIGALALMDQYVDKVLADANRRRFQQLHP